MSTPWKHRLYPLLVVALLLTGPLFLGACGSASTESTEEASLNPSTQVDFELDPGINEYSYILSLTAGCFEAHPELVEDVKNEQATFDENDPCILACRGAQAIATESGLNHGGTGPGSNFNNRLYRFFQVLAEDVGNPEAVAVLRDLCLASATLTAESL